MKAKRNETGVPLEVLLTDDPTRSMLLPLSPEIIVGPVVLSSATNDFRDTSASCDTNASRDTNASCDTTDLYHERRV